MPKAVIQRVATAKVTVDRTVIGKIDQGLLVLLAVGKDDTPRDMDTVVKKILNLRLFENSDGKFDYNVRDVKGGILVVSQFTLYGNCRKGNRPSFTDAAPPDLAKSLYDYTVRQLSDQHPHVAQGQFQASMAVELLNDGPVTVIL